MLKIYLFDMAAKNLNKPIKSLHLNLILPFSLNWIVDNFRICKKKERFRPKRAVSYVAECEQVGTIKVCSNVVVSDRIACKTEVLTLAFNGLFWSQNVAACFK
jgi:hypothetical protein